MQSSHISVCVTQTKYVIEFREAGHAMSGRDAHRSETYALGVRRQAVDLRTVAA